MTRKTLKPKFLAAILLVATLISFGNTGQAAEISTGAKVKIVNDSTTVPAKYSFIAQFNRNKTEVVPFGMAHTNTATAGGTPYISFNPGNNTSLKGKFGVTYTSIGRFEDKEIDLRITILDWKRYSTNTSGKISFTAKSIGENNQGFDWVDQKWEFYESGTNRKIKTNGYMTIIDLDSRQGMRFDRTTSNGINSLLIDPSAKGFLSYDDKNGEIFIYEENGVLTNNSDLHGMVTFLYDNLDTIRFKWERDFAAANAVPSRVYVDEIADGEYFGYIAKKPARTEMLDPDKDIEVDGVEGDVLDITSNKPFKFNLYHQVPDEWADFYYNSYVIKDTVDSRLAIQSIKVFNEEDRDLTSYFDNKTSGNTVNLVAKAANLKSSSFYNNMYRVEVTVKVRDSSTLTNAVVNGKVAFNNTFSVTQDGKTKNSNRVTGNLNQRNINVLHLDKNDQTTLEQISGKLFDGDSYSYSSKKTFKKGDYIYNPAPEETQKGIVERKDVVLKFFYQLPLIDINMKHLQIFTGDAAEGLPVKVQLTKKYPNGTNLPELANKKVKLSLFEKDGTTALITKEYSLKDVPTSINDWLIPKTALTKDTHKNYVVKISEIDKDIVSKYPEINTDGYTASNKTFSVNAATAKEISYKGVVMTEREITKDMQLHHETLTVPVKKMAPHKTGYGFEMKTEVVYVNDLLETTDIKLKSLVDKRLIDSYLVYQQQGDFNIVPLEGTKKTTSADKKQTNFIFEFPNVKVEEKTGYLFSNKQVADKDPRITNPLKDGMRKLYVPIWADLDSYNISLETIEPIGINKVTFNVKDQLTLYAYMFGTIGSDTIAEDEILIEPVDLENPFPNGLPKGWHPEDLEWLKGN